MTLFCFTHEIKCNANLANFMRDHSRIKINHGNYNLISLLWNIKSYTYLDSNEDKVGGTDRGIKIIIQKAHKRSPHNTNKFILKSKEIKSTLKIFNSSIKSALKYEIETWRWIKLLLILYEIEKWRWIKQLVILQTLINWCLHRTEGLNWCDRITNVFVDQIKQIPVNTKRWGKDDGTE